MTSENFGQLVIVFLSLLYLIGIGSLIISIFCDKVYTISSAPPSRKHYYNSPEKDDDFSVIINDND